jgi:polyphosphate kinase
MQSIHNKKHNGNVNGSSNGNNMAQALGANGTQTGDLPLFNRELSWIRFNERVLEEALDATHPLMERLKFLAIFSRNLDEFFMIRVSGLKEQVNAAIYERTDDGLLPQDLLENIAEMLHPLVDKQSRIMTEDVLPKLARNGVNLLHYHELDAAQKETLRTYFREKIFPILTPLAIDPSHPFPKLRGLGLNLLVEFKPEPGQAEGNVAVVPIPTSLPRFYSFINKPAYNFVLIEQIVEAHLEMLFPNMSIHSVSIFRLTRNADLDISEAEADDLLKLIERELRKRRLGTVIRLEVSDDMQRDSMDYLKGLLKLDQLDIYRVRTHLGLESFMQLLDMVDEKRLKDEPFTPALHPVIARYDSIFDAIKSQDILLHHPYDSFYPVVELLEEAAADPHVLAIKQTLYRTSGKSGIAQALREAALNGKHVTAMIELKARFDEETNITWAKELERSGVNVIYGIMGLKIHGKMCLVLRQEADGIRQYVHLSSGNYNEKTASVYTDIGLMTCNREIGEDVSELFNMLTGYSKQEQWRHIFVAPVNMRKNFIELVQRCIDANKPEQPSRIRLVMNSLVDAEMIEALYKASQAGVKIECVVRGICCLVPGLKNISENITVRSIVGRFLEHVRIYSFEYGGQNLIYSGSADWMPRNLNRRIEVSYPINDPGLKRQIQEILDVQMSDNVKARLLQPNGTYTHLVTDDLQLDQLVNAQLLFLTNARVRQRAIDTIYNH